MNEEIEYAEMLEIPVSTVNVVKRRRKERRAETLEETLIEKINEQASPVEESSEPLAQEEPALDVEAQPQEEPTQDFATVLVEDAPPVRWTRRRRRFLRELLAKKDGAEGEEATLSKASKIVYRVEFACACALCLGIFLTNVFMPSSAINTFFRTMTTTPQAQEDERVFSDFDLNSIVGEYSTAVLSVSPEGVVSFTAEGCVYPAVDGKVTDVLSSDGQYVVKIEHSPSFTSVLEGVDYVYYQIGDEVKHNVPVAYSNGKNAVQMTMYADGELLDCVQIDSENCLAWVEN
ncbi:MAG: hypothetical protein IJY11_02930 [Clostridia bacterium]|nr:hypothetical protein [Clostridia bacterium]